MPTIPHLHLQPRLFLWPPDYITNNLSHQQPSPSWWLQPSDSSFLFPFLTFYPKSGYLSPPPLLQPVHTYIISLLDNWNCMLSGSLTSTLTLIQSSYNTASDLVITWERNMSLLCSKLSSAVPSHSGEKSYSVNVEVCTVADKPAHERGRATSSNLPLSLPPNPDCSSHPGFMLFFKDTRHTLLPSVSFAWYALSPGAHLADFFQLLQVFTQMLPFQ